MKVFYYISLTCLVIEGSFRHEVFGRKGNGFKGCECNFMGARSLDGRPLSPCLNESTPKGVEQFAYKKWGNEVLAELCEGGTVAILYDCNARIPLYAATVMTGDQLDAGYQRPNAAKFSVSSHLEKELQQQDDDYKHSNDRNICYETAEKKYYVDTQWLRSQQTSQRGTSMDDCTGRSDRDLKSPVHRGHLIAASYGRGSNERIEATFKYTNSVPQFGAFNSGAWAKCEQQLRQWAWNNCFDDKDVRLHIVTGAIPSTFSPDFPKRFFGEAGFSDFEGVSKLPDTYGDNTGGPQKTAYRINVPSFMWTAACCTNNMMKTRSTAFYAKNQPGKGHRCETSLPGLNQLFSFLKEKIDIDIFPQSSCNKNFIKLSNTERTKRPRDETDP